MIDALGILLVVAAVGVILNRESVFIGAGITAAKPKGITAAKPKPKGITAAKPKPKPVLKSRFPTKTTYRPIRGQQTQQGSQVKQQHARTVAQWTKVSDIPPTTLKKIADTWIARARKIAFAKLAAIIRARQQSGYQNVQYTGGFGGSLRGNPTAGPSAISPDIKTAFEEGLGLKPVGDSSELSAAQKRMNSTINRHIDRTIKCGGDGTCKKELVKEFDETIFNNLYKLMGQFDPSQAQA